MPRHFDTEPSGSPPCVASQRNRTEWGWSNKQHGVASAVLFGALDWLTGELHVKEEVGRDARAQPLFDSVEGSIDIDTGRSDLGRGFRSVRLVCRRMPPLAQIRDHETDGIGRSVVGKVMQADTV